MKQLVINGKKSYDDFGVCIATRKISQPKKKSIKESVPFSNVTYDFSKIDGEIYWEERTLEYAFDIAEFTTEEMENVKSRLLDWLLNVHDADIYDPYIEGYHFHGSYDSDSWDEDFGSGTLNVSFTVYPYKISNEDTEVKFELVDKDRVTINNNSSHRIMPTVTSGGNFVITITKVFGKNLFDGELEEGFIDIETGKNNSSPRNSRTKNYIPVEPNTAYTLSSNIGVTTWGLYYDIHKNFIGYSMIKTVDVGGIRGTFTTPENTKYMKWYDVANNNLSTQFQLEKGVVATGYEPYNAVTENYSVGEGMYVDAFYLYEGENQLTITGDGEITFSYVEEVF